MAEDRLNGSDVLLAPLRGLLGAISPHGAHGRLTILIYHRVRPAIDPLFPADVDSARFDAHLRIVSRLFNVLPLADAIGRLRDGSLPARAASITFDDGYADNFDVALPILQRHRVSATFFVSTGFLDGGRMWNDSIIESIRRAKEGVLDLVPIGFPRLAIATDEEKRTAISELIGRCKYLEPSDRADRCSSIQEIAKADLPDDLMLTSTQVRELHDAGMGIGAHTVTHPILARIPDEAVRREAGDGKLALETLIGAPVRLFAYPNGRPGTDYGVRHVALIRSLGFDAAVSTGWGAATRETDVYQLPRFTPFGRTRAEMGLRFIRNACAKVPVAT